MLPVLANKKVLLPDHTVYRGRVPTREIHNLLNLVLPMSVQHSQLPSLTPASKLEQVPHAHTNMQLAIAIVANRYSDYRRKIVKQMAAQLNAAGYGVLCVIGSELRPGQLRSGFRARMQSHLPRLRQFSSTWPWVYAVRVAVR